MLKKIGFTINKISNDIDSDFSKQLYYKNGLKLISFRTLEKLINHNITPISILTKNEKISATVIRVCKPNIIPVHFQIDVRLAEIFGILLGDGNISERRVMVTLNGIDEDAYVKYVTNMLEEVFGVEVKFYDKLNDKAIDLRIYRKSLVKQLVDLGLIKGNKVRNQVSVPSWISDSLEYKIACVRGLIDTDGTIYRLVRFNKYQYVNVEFRNKSEKLLDFVESFCQEIGVVTTRRNFTVFIRAQASVKKFLELVKPNKMIYKGITIDDFV